MPVPKKKVSRSRRNKRRAHDHIKKPGISLCPQCSEVKLPHRVCQHCGTYKGKEVIEVHEV